MNVTASIVTPWVWKEERRGQQEQLAPYYSEYYRILPPDPSQNVKYHVYDPEWKERFWSIQAAHDCKHPGWMAVRVLFNLGNLAFVGGAALSIWPIFVPIAGAITICEFIPRFWQWNEERRFINDYNRLRSARQAT